MKIVDKARSGASLARPSRGEAEQAVETLLLWAGEDPAREGLRETPARFVRALEEHCSGYAQNPESELSRSFEDIDGYDDIVLVRDIGFSSHCEHHLHPITGVAHVAYWPDRRIVGISKLARVVEIYAKRLVTQETLTKSILDVMDRVLQPKGVAVLIRAEHSCMTTRGILKPGSSTVTSCYSGVFREDETAYRRFMDQVGTV